MAGPALRTSVLPCQGSGVGNPPPETQSHHSQNHPHSETVSAVLDSPGVWGYVARGMTQVLFPCPAEATRLGC